MEHLRITVAGQVYDVIVEKIDAHESENTPAPVRSPAPAAVAKPVPAPTTKAPASTGDATSPLAGIVQAIAVDVGATVQKGDLVITLEAMKMFTPITALSNGTVTAIHVRIGDAVEEGQALYTIS